MNESSLRRKPISKRIRFDVFKRDYFTCQYCGAKPPAVVLEIDHINPVANGGDNRQDNLITSCFDCNRGKSDRLLTSIPVSIEEKIILLKEKQEQMRAFERLIKSEKKNEERRIDEVEDAFKIYHEGFSFSGKTRESVRVFVQKIPFSDVVCAMHKACSRIKRRDDVIKYFFGICWNIIKGGRRVNQG